MRPYILLIFTALVLAFFSGRYIIKFQGPMTASSEDIIEINKIKLNFQKSVIPYAIVNFTSMYHSPERMLLMNPYFNLRTGKRNSSFSLDQCDNDSFKNKMSLNSKSYIWYQIRCKKNFKIPSWFISRPPYVDDSGTSYAFLLYEYLKEINYKKLKLWAKENIEYFHVKELGFLQKELGPLGGIYEILAGMNEDSLRSLLRKKGTILTSEYLLARIKYPTDFPILEYRFYSRKDLENFLEKTPYSISPKLDKHSCLIIDGPICWHYSAKHLFNMVSTNTVVSFLGVLFIFIMIMWILFSKIKEDKLEDMKRKMALQVLSHEFRTPVASLLLMVDKIGKRMDALDEQTQEDFLRMSSEVYRLQRLTEKSKHYLQSQRGKKLVSLNFEQVDYLEDIVEDVLTALENTYNVHLKRHFTHLEKQFSLDVYWFQIVLKNLVENALVHGKGQVYVNISVNFDNLHLAVSDEGEVKRSLKDLTTEFSKGNKSSGSGLGLSIIHKVIKDWGGKLELQKKPTRFTVKLPNVYKSEDSNGKDSLN